MGASLPLPSSLVMRAQQAKLDAHLRTSSSLGTPSIHFGHEYYPFVLVGGRLAPPMAVDLVDRLAILVALRRFPSMGAADFRSLRYEIYAHLKEFVRRSTPTPFRRFLGYVRREFMQRLHAVLHDTLGSYLRDPCRGWCSCSCVPSCSEGLGLCASLLLFSLLCWWIPLLYSLQLNNQLV
jgi:hypothetical protein